MNQRVRSALLTLTAFFLLFRAPTVGAQTITNPFLAPAHSSSVFAPEHPGPTPAAISVAVRTVVPVDAAPAPRGNAGLGQNEALMIVGGAAVLVGAIVGGTAGDFFMIGGAVVGLYGLYKYLQ
jgi:hypothetical protein